MGKATQIYKMLPLGQPHWEKNYFCGVINHKTLKTMQNSNNERMRLDNRLAAGKEPVGDFLKQQKGFASFDGFVTKNRKL
jgi:hypothetical protein